MILLKEKLRCSVGSFFLYPIVAWCMIGLLSGCTKDTKEVQGNDKKTELVFTDESEMYFSNGLVFTAEGGEKVLSFTINEEWSLNFSQSGGDVSWCTVFPVKGTAGENMVIVKVAANTTYDDRSLVLTLSAKELSKKLIVIQKQKDAITLTTAKYELDKNGGQIQVEVKANVPYEVIIPEQYQNWIHKRNVTRGLSTSNLTFTIDKSEEYDKREGEIIIQNEETSEILKIYQAGEGIILLTEDEYVVSDQGEELAVELSSNFEYEVKMPQVDWITTTTTRGISSHTLYYSIAPNETYSRREAEIVYYDRNDKSLSDTLRIIQAQKNAIVLSQKEYSVDSSETYIEVVVNSNVDFKINISDEYASWITKVENFITRGLVTRKLDFKIAANTSHDERVGKIEISNNNLMEIVTVKQVKQDAIIVDKAEYFLEYKGGDLSLDVKTNVELVVESSVDWIRQVSTRALNSKRLSFSVGENTGDDVRKGVIILRYGTLKQQIDIYQAASPKIIDLGLSVNWASYNIGAISADDYGGLYGWADPTGEKTSTNLDDYPTSNPPVNISGTIYDIVRMKWGDGWRLPTLTEIMELKNKCIGEWTNLNGINGYKIIGPSGKYIFLPAAGMGVPAGFAWRTEQGFYWSGTLHTNGSKDASTITFDNSSWNWTYGCDRYLKLSVRPVKDKEKVIYNGNIEIYSQKELDALDQVGYTEIKGNLSIIGNDIIDIPNFNTLTTIDGLLEINSCKSLLQCSGFKKLNTVNNGFRILNCDNLNSIEGFNSLRLINLSKSVGGYQGFYVENCTNLKIIEGFNELYSIVGPFYLRNVPKLETISGYKKLQRIGHWFSIQGAYELAFIEGFDLLEDAGIEIHFYDATKLCDISFLSNIKSVESLQLKTPALKDLSPIKNIEISKSFGVDGSSLEKIELNIPKTLEGLYLENCSKIRDASCFNELKKIGRLQIMGNISEYLLESLSNVKVVSQRLEIMSVDNLITLDAFSNIAVVGNESGFNVKLLIANNKNLVNYDGIKNAINSSLGYQINGNKYNPSIEDILEGKQYGE